jgi:hypothetical protein
MARFSARLPPYFTSRSVAGMNCEPAKVVNTSWRAKPRSSKRRAALVRVHRAVGRPALGAGDDVGGDRRGRRASFCRASAIAIAFAAPEPPASAAC